eukprot:452696-Pelagomonas_calceolata.AAC.1
MEIRRVIAAINPSGTVACACLLKNGKGKGKATQVSHTSSVVSRKNCAKALSKGKFGSSLIDMDACRNERKKERLRLPSLAACIKERSC